MLERRQVPRRGATLVAMGLLIGTAGCDPPGRTPVIRTEKGQLELTDAQAIVGAASLVDDPSIPFLVSSQLCPRIDCSLATPGCELDGDPRSRLAPEAVLDCFTQAVDDPSIADFAGACLSLYAAGEVTWSFTPRPCVANRTGFTPGFDRLTLTVVEVAEVDGNGDLQPRITAHFEAPGAAFARRELVPADGESFPDDAGADPDGAFRVLAGQPVDLAVVLEETVSGRLVGWNPASWTAGLSSEAGDALPFVWRPQGLLGVDVPADAVGLASISIGGFLSSIGKVRAVDPADLSSLEVVVGYAPPTEPGGPHGPPVGARAIVRTADGAAVHGVPVDWRVGAGALPLWRDDRPGWGPDYVALIDEQQMGCLPPPPTPRAREATVVAKFGDLQALAVARWEAPGIEPGAPPFEPAPQCAGPALPVLRPGCRAHPHPGTLGLLLLVLAVRRRPKATCRSPRSRPCTSRSRPCA